MSAFLAPIAGVLGMQKFWKKFLGSMDLGIDMKEVGGYLKSFLNSQTGAHLTGQQIEANEMQMQNIHDQYAQHVSGMQDAGLNPAMMYAKSGVSSAPTVQASPGTGSMSDLMSMITLPLQMRMLQAQTRGQQIQNDIDETSLAFLSQEKQTALAYTAAQIATLESQLKNDEVQRALGRAGISQTEAETSLAVQRAIAEHIDNATRDAINNATLQYRAAETAYTNQKTEESKAEVSKISAEITELYQRALLDAAQAGYFSQSERNLLVENGLLRLDEKSKQFEVDYQKADRVWRNALGTVDAVSSVVRAGASVLGAGVAGKLFGGSSKSSGSIIYRPTGTSMFEQNYRR